MRTLFLPVLALIVLAGSPALAHEEGHHGLPGVAHSLSADHQGWLLVAAIGLLVAIALGRPVLRALKARGRRK